LDDGWEKGFAAGFALGLAQGEKANKKRSRDEEEPEDRPEGGKRGTLGWAAGWEGAAGPAVADRAALAEEDDQDEEEPEDAREGRKATRKRPHKWSDWFDAYEARDPPDKHKFPRFQVWNGHEWTECQERVNQSLRDSRHAEVDLGTFEGVVYKYEVRVVEEGSQGHEEVYGAALNVKHHKLWQNDESEHQVVGWQIKVDEEGPCAS